MTQPIVPQLLRIKKPFRQRVYVLQLVHRVGKRPLVEPAPQSSQPGSLQQSARVSDEWLIGTWQSDADRTIAEMRGSRPLDGKQEPALRKLFGKMQITWTPTTYTTELDGVTEGRRYEVLGRDKLSFVVHEIEPRPAPLERTEFTVIHFEGAGTYCLSTKAGSVREYFKRVR